MEILQEITKEVFEKNVPVAKMPERNTSVYDRLQLTITTAYAFLIKNVVSSSMESEIEGDESLKKACVRVVCLDAFYRSIRSLDLVLTATGFGIVSTETTAPASKTRVDALAEETAQAEIEAIDDLVQLLTRKTGWGTTEQAAMRIPTLFYRPNQLKVETTLPMTSQNWQMAKGRAATADALLRGEISDEYMDELLVKTRSASLTNADVIIIQKCSRFIGDFISNFELTGGRPNRDLLRPIVEQLESYKESYDTYVHSRLYAKRHAERYKNEKQDPTFFFM